MIGSPLDNSGAGAAYLYSPAGALLTTFVQPGGGGGNFGAAVAGSQNTALIGAPGANLGTAGAGAVYVFDADPTSPTFGQPIAAEQEPTPDTGGLFGTAVGFDNGAIVVGAAGALGSAAAGNEDVELYQGDDVYGPGAMASASSSTTYATGGAYDSVIVSATFTDANPAAALTATINWGDGTTPTVPEPAGRVPMPLRSRTTTRPTPRRSTTSA